MAALRHWADSFQDWFPREGEFSGGYCHWHLPAHRRFVDGPRARRRLRKQVVEHLLHICGSLSANKPSGAKNVRVIAFVSLPALFDSDVTVFIGDEHYAGFFSRDSDEQRWTILPKSRSLKFEWGLRMPADLRELGLAEQRLEGGQAMLGEIWCYGDVPDRLDG